MKQTTLVLVFDTKQNIILCMKKRWFWAGLYNWAWWKVEAWETIIAWAVRELFEETSIKASEIDLDYRWVLHFYFDENKAFDQDINLFVIKDYDWDFAESEEMKPERFAIVDIPYDKMWEDDYIWLPRVIAGESVEYDFTFDANWKMSDYKVKR